MTRLATPIRTCLTTLKFDTKEIYDKITIQFDKRCLYWSRDPGAESQNALRKLTVKYKQSVSATERSMRITRRRLLLPMEDFL